MKTNIKEQKSNAVDIGGNHFEINRSARKTIAFEVCDNGRLIIRAPQRASDELIKNILEKEQFLISQKIEKIKEYYAAKTKLSAHNGGKILYLGREITVLHRQDYKKPSLDGSALILPVLDDETAKAAVIQFLKSEAKRILTERVRFYAERFDFHFSKVGVNSAASRWGSCSGQNSLNFSYRLIFAAPDVIDYVVVHELSHTKEHNHSAKFWAVVGSVLPDYKERRQKLLELQRNYDIKSL